MNAPRRDASSPPVDSWYHEKESAWLYRQVAAAEPDSHKSRLFLALAAAAEEQAAKWEASARRTAAARGNTHDAGAPGGSGAAGGSATPGGNTAPGDFAGPGPGAPPSPRLFQPNLRARIVSKLLKQFGPRSMRTVLAAMKLRGLSIYSAPVAIAGHAMPTSVAEIGARHRSAMGGNLRASVFGVNDGLVSNASLVLGVAGAGADSRFVLMTGIAGLLAGALSMASGEYVSVRSQREMYEYQMALEREEVAEYPEEEAEELALIYQARGVDLEEARKVSKALLARPEQALDVLAREELGLNPDDLGSPWQAATASFLSFSAGSAVPLIPFLASVKGTPAVIAAAALTATVLFGVGMALSLFTGRDAWRGAFRMVLIGGGAGIVSFLVGRAVGAAIS